MSFLNRGREKGGWGGRGERAGQILKGIMVENFSEVMKGVRSLVFRKPAKSQAGYIKRQLGKPRQHIKKQRHHLVDKGPSSQSYGFSSSHVRMRELDHKESWAPENWWFRIMVLEKTLESPLDCKDIKPVNTKGNQPWIFFGRTDAAAEAPILWPPDVKSRFIGKDSDAGKDWGQEEKGTTEDEMVGWHHRLNGHEFEQTQGDSEGQGSLVCCSPRGRRESDTTEQLHNSAENQSQQEKQE